MKEKNRKVFLSYAKADHEAARRVGHHLRQAGFEVWDPDTEILPGSDWAAELKAALDSAWALVVFISPESMETRSVRYEIEYALGAKHLSQRLVPILLRPTKNVPWILSSLKSVEYLSPSRASREIVHLLSQPQDATEAKRRAS